MERAVLDKFVNEAIAFNATGRVDFGGSAPVKVSSSRRCGSLPFWIR